MDEIQLSLEFDVDRQRVPKLPKLRLLTKDGEQLVMAPGRTSLVRDPDGLVSRLVKSHSAKKAHTVRRYAQMVATGMKDGWFGDKRYWVELCAGPGQLFEDETGLFIPGSPLDALNVAYPFTGCVFVECDGECADALAARVRPFPNATVLHGDCNDELVLDKIRAGA